MDCYKIEWDSRALKELQKIPDDDAKIILQKVSELSKSPYSGTALKGGFKGYFRLRSGNYRVIYSIKKHHLLILILRVGSRKDIYRTKSL
ncbi:MAG: type II toxin-antitoxin system RelE/ParE family toxin [Candidatus Marinimicrobia bacterium]|nr:type II toxin-antitoxin system RelE/ParE family toxin [Candidatus Neomarinimicrobiota bacterium]